MAKKFYVKINCCESCNRHDLVEIAIISGFTKAFLNYNRGKYYNSWRQMKEWLKDKTILKEGNIDTPYFEKSIDSFTLQVEGLQKKECNDYSLDIDGYDFYNSD